MKNLVQALMQDRPTDWLTILERDFKIHVVRDGALASLKYNQIESPMREPIVQQCRGMVVDVERRVVFAWPYDKFWNYGETEAATIDWSTARVQEKMDGSLLIWYWREGERPPWWRPLSRWHWHRKRGWCVASSGHPTAGGSFGADKRTFGQAFWDLARTSALRHQAADMKVTYLFELCDAPNRVVVRHEQPRLVLHGARWLETGVELTREELLEHAARMDCEIVREFPIRTIEDCLTAARELDPLQQEGFVVVDAQCNRIKIKSPRYVILHHMKGEATPRRAIELWQTGETGELLTHFPEMVPAIVPIQEQLDSIAEQAVKDFAANYPRPTRKEFALAIKDRPWSAVLFRLLDCDPPTVADAKAIMRRMTTAALERLIELSPKT
jgi:hypothetical protein